jgi:hypothetical protein
VLTDDFDDFSESWATACESAGKPPTAAGIQFAFDVLREYALRDVQRALIAHARDPDRGQYAPKPADVVRLIDGGTEELALIAWAKVDKAVRSVGTYATVVFDDAMIHRVIADMCGWVGLGQKTEDDWPFVAREFEKRYRAYALRRNAGDYPARLAGLCDAVNVSGGYAEAEPVLIGDQGKALEVMRLGNRRHGLEITRDAGCLPTTQPARIAADG